MKKTFLAMVMLFGIIAGAHAQNLGSDYQTAIGVKMYPGAISFKTFMDDNTAVEGLAYFWTNGFRATALYELHGDISDVEGLKWYVGPGAHVGFYNDRWRDKYPNRNGGIAIGVDGVLGLDYKISGAPINVSIDWQPSLNLIGHTYFEGGWGGLGVRFTF
ncbi:hypothetical protein HNQ91_001462 [Filimonas zeae]|uniref:DUF3575 domain-containing protein n=1 Tax=Filimonas zeae TaxID=1737353 RepID=A0A917MWF7_9BACT|nr:hypothetical protein [Filimonas zeae]MDR6338411.1 hypothetical protein [Filimonas zeae]GGH68392.1 hypothetical protein GCM10011379_24650 [Filimonas zeae]